MPPSAIAGRLGRLGGTVAPRRIPSTLEPDVIAVRKWGQSS
jgi:hypothetical protein